MPKEETASCYIQGFMSQFFSLAELLTILLFVYKISQLFGDGVRSRKISQLSYKTYLFVWGSSLVSAIVPLLTGKLTRVILFFIIFGLQI